MGYSLSGQTDDRTSSYSALHQQFSGASKTESNNMGMIALAIAAVVVVYVLKGK